MNPVLTMYTIYHKPTDCYMPAMKTNRGSTLIDISKWNSMHPPRVFKSFVAARNALITYCKGVHKPRYYGYELEGGIDITPQPNRKKEDFEIHEVSFNIVTRLTYKGEQL